MLTKAEMVGKAEAAGYGERLHLGRAFVDWQQRGLLGKALTKASRRGGEGLWHDGQGELWLELLRDRLDEGVSIESMANRPVAHWLLGNPAVRTGQAQLALITWARLIYKPRPVGTRSARARAIEARVTRLAPPGASQAQRRRLRAFLELLNDGVKPNPAQLHEALRIVTSDREAVLALAAEVTHQLEAQRHLDELNLATPAVLDYWRWARVLWIGQLPEFVPIPASEVLNFACARLLVVLGMALSLTGGRVQVPAGQIAPLDLI